MNTQELFDKAISGLYEQNQPSSDSMGKYCAYRGAHNTKCAVGHLIQDQFYVDTFEGHPCYKINIKAAIESSIGRKLTDKEVRLLGKLQRMHDNSLWDCYDSFREILLNTSSDIAKKFNLQPWTPNEVPA